MNALIHKPVLLFFNLGASEILIIAMIILLLFGGKKIPELMKGLGKGIRDFKNAKEGVMDEIKNEVKKIEK